MPIPKPRKGESQDAFIGRCMGDETMTREYKDQKQRAAVCYSTWREAKAEAHLDRAFTLESAVALDLTAAPDGKPKTPTFGITAYTGGALRIGGYYIPVVLDLAGLRAGLVTVLKDHDPQQVIGQGQARVTRDTVSVAGSITGDVDDKADPAGAVVAHARRGFQWSASVGVQVERMEKIEPGSAVTVNGKDFTGPLMVARQGRLGEVSFVSVGADEHASASVAASVAGGICVKESEMDFSEWLKALGLDEAGLKADQVEKLRAKFEAESKPANPPEDAKDGPAPPVKAAAAPAAPDPVKAMRQEAAAEAQRLADVHRLCAGASAEIEAKAISEGWDATKTELEVLRASRPKPPAPPGGGNAALDRQVIEAALCLKVAAASDDRLLKVYGQDVMNRADERRHISIRRVAEMCAARAGLSLPDDVGTAAWMRAAFSTNELSGILGNVANKALAGSFAASAATVPRICRKASHTNFLTHTVYSMALSGDFEEVGTDGELKHLSLGEEYWTRRVATRGARLTITRQDLVNDSLGAFTDMGQRIGRKAAVAREKAMYTLINGTGAGTSHFTAARGNYISGATTALGNDAGIEAALAAFRGLTSPDGDPAMIEPVLLLVPKELEGTALRLFNSESLIVTGLSSTTAKGTQPGTNVWRNRFKPVVSSCLSNSAFTGYSSTAWYLLADPNDVGCFEVAYLNGKEEPTVEYFGLEADADVLGVTWRAYFDFGVALAEYRGGVKSKGAA